MFEQKRKEETGRRFVWISKELCRFYKRPRAFVGVGEEEHLVFEVCQRPDVKSEWAELQRCRDEIGERFFPQSLAVLCRDWGKTLDRARNHAPPPKQFKEKSIQEKELDKMAKSLGL